MTIFIDKLYKFIKLRPLSITSLLMFWQPLDQGSNRRQERTRQVDEPRRGVLPTSSHLRLLTVHRSDTWWTVSQMIGQMKATVADETSTINLSIKVIIE